MEIDKYRESHLCVDRILSLSAWVSEPRKRVLIEKMTRPSGNTIYREKDEDCVAKRLLEEKMEEEDGYEM